MHTSVNNKFFLKGRKFKEFLVRTMEIMGSGMNDGYMTPYGDVPGASAFNVFKSIDKGSGNGNAAPSRADESAKPEARSNPRAVYETGIVGGAVDDGRHQNLDLAAKSALIDRVLETKKAETGRARMDETEITIWIMMAIMLALTILAFVVLEMRIAG